MATIIATQNFNATEPSTKIEQLVNEETLLQILKELKKLNFQMTLMTDEEINNTEVD